VQQQQQLQQAIPQQMGQLQVGGGSTAEMHPMLCSHMAMPPQMQQAMPQQLQPAQQQQSQQVFRSAVQEHQSHAPRARAPPSKDFTHCFVPKSTNLVEEFSKSVTETPITTVMLRNVPNRYTQQELIEELDQLGFAGNFDFVYAPTDFGTMGNVGYAFVNFIDAAWAARCQKELEGYLFMKHQKKMTKKHATVSVAHLQGLQANLRHYEKSAVAGRARSKGCGPVVLAVLSSVVPM